MKKFKFMLLLAAVLMIAGCSGTDLTSSDIIIGTSGNSENSSPVESTESEVFVNEEITAVIEKIAVSDKNVFVSSAPEFIVDNENAAVTLNVDYTNYIDVRTLENLFLDIEIGGGTFELAGDINSQGGIDITKTAYLVVTDDSGKRKRYTLNANRTVHDLPIVNISLENSAAASSIKRDDYTRMEMYIDCSGSPEFSDTDVLSGAVRGRGHSSWNWEKKPYRIKFDNSVPIMGMPKNRDWILLANHADKSLIRNFTAYDMARELDFVWTGTQYPVDLFVNGVYQGVYALGEHREISQHRINLDESSDIDRGYLLEVGGADGDDMKFNYDFFHTKSDSVRFITFTDPQANKLTEEQRQFVMDYVNKADAAIVSGTGYGEYIDVQSFCDWIIMQELTCNLDGCFRRSCYMTKDKGGKLKMGPVWDFDMAFGNFQYDHGNYSKWFTVGSTASNAYIRVNWCNYLMNDPEFRAQIKARWFEVRDTLLDAAKRSIEKNKARINASQGENFTLWNIWDKQVGYESSATVIIKTYEEQVKYVEDFLESRAKWIDENI